MQTFYERDSATFIESKLKNIDLDFYSLYEAGASGQYLILIVNYSFKMKSDLRRVKKL